MVQQIQVQTRKHMKMQIPSLSGLYWDIFFWMLNMTKIAKKKIKNTKKLAILGDLDILTSKATGFGDQNMQTLLKFQVNRIKIDDSMQPWPLNFLY